VSLEQNWRRRLYWTGVQLDAVAACLDRSFSRDTEGSDQGLDLPGLHGLGNLAGLHVRAPGGPEQDTLVIGARALPPRVAQRGDHEAPSSWQASEMRDQPSAACDASGARS